MTEFDADTALEPAGEGRWRGVVPGSWSIGAGINGGFFAALATRAAERATDLPARSLTVHYLVAPAADEPVEVTVTTGRRGRSTAFLQLAFTQAQGLVASALAVCAAWRDDAPAFQDAAPPAVPPVEDCVRVRPDTSVVPPLMAKYDMHVAVDPEARPAHIEGWVRTAEPRACDDVLLAALTDAFMPPAFVRMHERVYVPTLELTVHFRGRPPAGEHPWVIGSFSSRAAAGGVVEEDGELWSPDGVLLAQSRQLAIMRRA